MIPESLAGLFAPVERALLEQSRGHWEWLVGPEYTVVGMTTMGDWLFLDSRGAVHLLETLEATFECIALNVEQLVQLAASEDYRDDTFLQGFAVAALQSASLPPNHCVGFKVPPVLGGPMNTTNLHVTAAASYQAWTGRLHEALSELPEGSQVLGVDVDDEGALSVRWQAPGTLPTTSTKP